MEKEICDMYLNFFSLNEIKKKNGFSQRKITNILKKNGISIRSKSPLKRKINSHTLNENYFEYIDTQNKAYWLGYLSADGCISKNNYKVTLSSKDKDIILKFKNEIETSHPLGEYDIFDKRTQKFYKRFSIQITSKIFTNFLIKLGVTANKSYVCTPPNIDKSFIYSYVRGLLDGDGSFILRNKKTIVLQFLGTFEILNFINNFIFKDLNIKMMDVKKMENNKNYNLYKLIFYKNAINILEKIYVDSEHNNRLDRKYENYCKIKLLF